MFSKRSLKGTLAAVFLATLGISGVAAARPRFGPEVTYGRPVFSPYDFNRDGRLDRFELRRMRHDQEMERWRHRGAYRFGNPGRG
jgi:hypothetical protein